MMGILDILAAGNLFNVEVVTPRNDGGIGVFLKGDGEGRFHGCTLRIIGIFAPGDVKSLALIHINNKDREILVGNNNDRLQIFRVK